MHCTVELAENYEVISVYIRDIYKSLLQRSFLKSEKISEVIQHQIERFKKKFKIKLITFDFIKLCNCWDQFE